jgi:hypothetical protein
MDAHHKTQKSKNVFRNHKTLVQSNPNRGLSIPTEVKKKIAQICSTDQLLSETTTEHTYIARNLQNPTVDARIWEKQN